MNFEPQIPEWGLDDFKNHQDKLFEYHEWLKNTAIKTGLISKKTDPVSYTHLTLPTKA